MKLLYKTTFYYLFYALFLFIIGTVSFYIVLKTVLIDSVDDALYQEKSQIIENLDYEKSIEHLKPSENIIIKRASHPYSIPNEYETLKIRKKNTNEYTDYRTLTSYFEFNNKNYFIIIRQSLDEVELLLNSIFPASVILFIIFTVGVVITNSYINKKVWKHFYDIMQQIQEYDFEKAKFINHQKSDIKEFNDLSLSIEKMTTKIYKDYINQKEFIENSSHELKTPISIIRNRLELLIQSNGLTEHDMEHISIMFDATKKLNLLNQALILISQIENGQHASHSLININELIEKTIQHFSDFIADKQIKIVSNINYPLSVDANKILMDIIISNIISNSIKHNIEGGTLKLTTSPNTLEISNTGKAIKQDTNALFDRYNKESKNENSTGLGLAIVKRICDIYNYKIQYAYNENLHAIKISFDNL